MKTIRQITRKAQSLKKRLSHQQIVENFGDKEIRQLDDYVGNVYDYPQENRLEIFSMLSCFSDWCMNYTG